MTQRYLLAATLVAACGPATTPAPAPVVENAQPREVVDAQPPLAVVVVVDRSGSMTGPKLDSSRDGALALAAGLPDDALFAMVAFDSEAVTLVRLQPARNRDRIAEGIARLTAGGGTHIYPALASAAEMLEAAQAAREVVVLLSDGEAPYDGVVELVTDMRDRGVTTHAIGLTGADQQLLGMIVEAGGGALVMVDDPAAVGGAMRGAIE